MTPRMLTTTMIAGLAIGAAGLATAQTAGGANPSSYCDEGYWQADLDRDEIITTEEAIAGADEIFAAIDEDGDGVITQTEYADCRGAWLTHASAPDTPLAEELAALDRDGDEVLSMDEYMGAAMESWEGAAQPTDVQSTSTGAAAEGGGEASAEGRPASGDPVVLFRRLIIVPAEGDRGPADMTREEAANRAAMRFLLLDTDRSETVDAQEWAQQESLKNDLSDVINQQFEDTDTDASGGLTREEVRAAAQRRGEEAMARAEAAGEGSDVGAPVVYFVYPHPM